MFLHQYEIMKMDYQRLVDEAKDIQSQLDEQTQQTIAIDRKLNYARKMLESERKARRAVETEKSQLVRSWTFSVEKPFLCLTLLGNKVRLIENIVVERPHDARWDEKASSSLELLHKEAQVQPPTHRRRSLRGHQLDWILPFGSFIDTIGRWHFGPKAVSSQSKVEETSTIT